jgi:REP element-mobilizing transposase RayT
VIPQITRNHEKRRSSFYHGIHGLARAIAPGYPPHVIQHGNRRRQTFFSNADYEACLALMAEWCAQYRVEVWAYCLMPNHAHLICVPQTEDSVRLAVGKAHPALYGGGSTSGKAGAVASGRGVSRSSCWGTIGCGVREVLRDEYRGR